MRNFGTQFFGQFTAFRLNCKMTTAQRNDMRESYPMISFDEIGKGLTRVEGALEHIHYQEFKMHLAVTLAKYKAIVAFRLARELQNKLENYADMASL
jgi:hypothetical protein